MSDSDESRSFASMAMDNEPAPTVVEESERSGSKIEEGYSLVILIKSLVMVEVPEIDTRTLNICITLGETETKLSGTMAEINEQRRGSAISVPASNAQEFKQFLMDNSLHLVIYHEAIELGQSTIWLGTTNLTMFDPPEFEPTMIKNGFPIVKGTSSIGTINLLLKTDRVKSSIELDAAKLEDDSVMYIVNDSPLRRSSEYQEDTMRQLLTCKKCNVLKSPSEISWKYDLIDGILVNKEHHKKDTDLETMKRKIQQIQREAKLYPVGKEQELPKEDNIDRFCKSCGGYSVTGATCAKWKKPTDVPLFEARCGYPEGTAKRFSENVTNGMPENLAHISEPNFTIGKDVETRFHQVRSESYPLNSMQHQGTTVLCPQSVGHRFCQRCSLNMDWLPLHSTCPKCGYIEPTEHPISSYSTGPKTAPNRLESWMGSFKLPNTFRRRSSSGTIRSVSLNLNSCPLCQLRGGRCPDCEKRALSNNHEQNSITQSSTSDSEMLARKEMERPKTRSSLKDRFGRFPKKIDKATRLSELLKVYGEDSSNKQEQPRRRSTRSSVVSLNVEEILKKTDTHKRKIVSGGVQSVELRKVDSRPTALTTLNHESLSSKQIRKNQRSLLQRIKKQNRGKYSYHYGKRYPGIVIGHRECIHEGSSVPPHMGWMWNVKTLGIGKIRKGWRPGAVRKPIKELMQHFLVSYPLDNIPVSKRGGHSLRFLEDDPTSLKQKPTLQIIKKNGEYCIVMNPLKDSKSLKTAQDPYLACDPIRFRLATDSNVGKLYQLRQALKIKGFTMCGCSELESCEHKSVKEKKLMKKELRKLIKCLGLPKSTELKDVPIDSESEMDLEFTPPSAMLKSGQRKPDVVCTETQYCVDDYKVQIPVDKLKCKPGREDPQDVGSKGVKNKIGRGKANDTKLGTAVTRIGGTNLRGTSGKGTNGANNTAGTGKGIGAGAGKGASGKGIGGTKVESRAGIGATGSKTGAAGRHK